MIPAQTGKLEQVVPQGWVLTPALARPGQRLFWALLVAELLLLLGAFLWALNSLLPATPVALADSATRQQVVDAVYARLNNDVPDRMIAVAPGMLARESNLRGFSLDGRVYYYQLLNQPSFDPLGSGQVLANQVEFVHIAPRAALPLRIYTLAW